MSYGADIARSVRRYAPEDKPALREFQIEYFGPHSRQCDDAYFDWLFVKNPYQEPGRPTLWICKRDGVVLGQQASIPVLLKAGAFHYKAAWGMDLMVRTEWRLKGVAPALSAAFEQSAEVLLGQGMSEAAHRAFMRRGWTDMGMLPVLVRPLDPAVCARTPHAPRVTRLTPRFATRGSASLAGLAFGRLAGFTLEPIAAFDEGVDRVWSLASGDYPVLVKRDLSYIRWRFDEIPGETGYRRYYLKRKGEVLGYAVVRHEPWRGGTVGRVIDYLAPQRCLRPLFALLIRELDSQGVAAVLLEQLHRGAQPILRSVGCFGAPVATRFIFEAREGAAPARGLLSTAGSWLLSTADSDLDHEASYRPTAAGTLSVRPEPESSSA